MPSWYDSTVLADSVSLTGGTAEVASFGEGDGYHTPVVCIKLEDLEGAADDTVTVEFDGTAATYQQDQRTLSSPQSYTVELPQCEGVRVTSSNGVTYSIEVRNNPR